MLRIFTPLNSDVIRKMKLQLLVLFTFIAANTIANEDCSNLSRANCIASQACILVQEESPSLNYQCVAPSNECEQTFAATNTCPVEAGCNYTPYDCYCHCRGNGQTNVKDGNDAPSCLCECALGKPATCSLPNV